MTLFREAANDHVDVKRLCRAGHTPQWMHHSGALALQLAKAIHNILELALGISEVDELSQRG